MDARTKNVHLLKMKRVWSLFLVNFVNTYNINTADPEIINFDQSFDDAWCGYDFDVSNEDIIIGCPKQNKVLECDFSGNCNQIDLSQSPTGDSDCWRLFGSSNCHKLGDFWGASIARNGDKLNICAPFRSTRHYWYGRSYDGRCAQYRKYNQRWYLETTSDPDPDTGINSMLGLKGLDFNDQNTFYSAPRRVDQYRSVNDWYETGSFRIGRSDGSCPTLDDRCTAQPGPLQHFIPEPPVGPISRSTANSNVGYAIKLFHVGKVTIH